ncbi:hypothetical protein T492DRAFT_1142271 [Pavlovales sp. CCMP2436]|nr:hypothetical protein T492DRAFT_1142271 [Pavlovales sp. CCMP2436]
MHLSAAARGPPHSALGIDIGGSLTKCAWFVRAGRAIAPPPGPVSLSPPARAPSARRERALCLVPDQGGTRPVPCPRQARARPGAVGRAGDGRGRLQFCEEVRAGCDVARVGSSSVAGGMLWAVGRLLAASQGAPPPASYSELLELAESGDSSRADLTVSDVHGDGCAAIGFSPSVPAASLAKTALAAGPGAIGGWAAADAVQSLVWMVTWNAAQIVALESKRLGVSTIYFDIDITVNISEGGELNSRYHNQAAGEI